jgi:hypothetical protein
MLDMRFFRYVQKQKAIEAVCDLVAPKEKLMVRRLVEQRGGHQPAVLWSDPRDQEAAVSSTECVVQER